MKKTRVAFTIQCLFFKQKKKTLSQLQSNIRKLKTTLSPFSIFVIYILAFFLSVFLFLVVIENTHAQRERDFLSLDDARNAQNTPLYPLSSLSLYLMYIMNPPSVDVSLFIESV